MKIFWESLKEFQFIEFAFSICVDEGANRAAQTKDNKKSAYRIFLRCLKKRNVTFLSIDIFTELKEWLKEEL